MLGTVLLVLAAPLAWAQTSYNMYYTASTTPLPWTSPRWIGEIFAASPGLLATIPPPALEQAAEESSTLLPWSLSVALCRFLSFVMPGTRSAGVNSGHNYDPTAWTFLQRLGVNGAWNARSTGRAQTREAAAYSPSCYQCKLYRRIWNELASGRVTWGAVTTPSNNLAAAPPTIFCWTTAHGAEALRNRGCA